MKYVISNFKLGNWAKNFFSLFLITLNLMSLIIRSSITDKHHINKKNLFLEKGMKSLSAFKH